MYKGGQNFASKSQLRRIFLVVHLSAYMIHAPNSVKPEIALGCCRVIVQHSSTTVFFFKISDVEGRVACLLAGSLLGHQFFHVGPNSGPVLRRIEKLGVITIALFQRFIKRDMACYVIM